MGSCFKRENTFIIIGHGNNNSQERYELKENEYGAIPTKCGEGLFYNFKSLMSFFDCENIPKPSAEVSLKTVSESIYPNVLANKGRFRNFKIYRPKLPLNTAMTKARWTIPDISIELIDYKINDFANNYKEVTILFSGIFSAASEVYPSYKKIILHPDDFNKTIIEIISNYSKPSTRSEYILAFNFLKTLRDLLSKSAINFNDMCKIVNIGKYINYKNLTGGTDHDVFKQLSNDTEFLKKELYNITIQDLLNTSVNLSFIYNFINNLVKGEEFLLVVPVCRDQNPALSRYERTSQRRFSRNYSGSVAYPNILDPINPRRNNTNVGENPQPLYMSAWDPKDASTERYFALRNQLSNIENPRGGRRKTRRSRRQMRRASRRQK
jgi:hypothetical protein